MEVYGGYSRRKRVRQSDIRRMAQGGRKADQIQKISDSHHQEVEIPQAEDFLEQELSAVYRQKPTENFSSKILPPKNFFTRMLEYIQNFFKRIFFSPK